MFILAVNSPPQKKTMYPYIFSLQISIQSYLQNPLTRCTTNHENDGAEFPILVPAVQKVIGPDTFDGEINHLLLS
jgi:hypothetical protein